MNILIGIVVSLIALIVAITYIYYFGKQPDYKFGKAEPDESLGEYGQLEAQLKDAKNPYSGAPIFDGPVPIIGLVLVAAITYMVYE